MRVPLYNGTGGCVSIMQRESSAGSHIPTSTTGLPMRSVTSSALLPTPMESGQHQPPSSLPQVREELVYQHGLFLFYKRRGKDVERVFAVSNGGDLEDILLKTGNFMSTSSREVRYNVEFLN